jgi:superoxide dismutase, Cu-Zn family
MQHALVLTAITLVIGVASSSCTTLGPANDQAVKLPATATSAAVGGMAVAVLVTPSGQPSGTATLRIVNGGVEVTIEASGLQLGAHGFHIHANGACASGVDASSGKTIDFGAAGGHFDPGAAQKHGRPGQAGHEAHAGELPNLLAGADGRAAMRYVNPNVSLAAGPVSIVGRTLVVHADPDDYATDPAGNSGARLLCGVIEMSRR